MLTKMTEMTMHLKVSQQLPMMALPLSLSVILSTMALPLLPSMSLPTVGSWSVVSVAPMLLLLSLDAKEGNRRSTKYQHHLMECQQNSNDQFMRLCSHSHQHQQMT